MDGFHKNKNVVVIGATNRIKMLDGALLRSGRFDTKLAIEMPKKHERLGIMMVHLEKKSHSISHEIMNLIAEKTDNYSGADMENIINEAAYICVSKNRQSLTSEDLFESFTKIAKERDYNYQ